MSERVRRTSRTMTGFFRVRHTGILPGAMMSRPEKGTRPSWISHAATQPRDKELIALKHALNAHGLHPDITREYVKGTTSPGYWHSAMAVEVVEDI